MIVFQNVSKQFGDSSFALKDVTFEVDPGELILVTGPSGSGKTTLMRMLTREHVPTQGEIFFQSKPLSSIKSSQVHHHRRQIGVVFQDYRLLHDLNVYENIALALEIIGAKQEQIEERVTDLLELIQLTEKAFLFPSQLSGGEAQRVSIARALATAPTVIFADEPTGNLDPVTSLTITKLLKKINELGTTVLVATHDQGVVKELGTYRHIKLENGLLTSDTGNKNPKAKTKPTEETKTEDSKDKPQTDEPPKKSGLGKFWPFGKKTAPEKPQPQPKADQPVAEKSEKPTVEKTTVVTVEIDTL
jgi:cell division transport system ATP-binding protein